MLITQLSTYVEIGTEKDGLLAGLRICFHGIFLSLVKDHRQYEVCITFCTLNRRNNEFYKLLHGRAPRNLIESLEDFRNENFVSARHFSKINKTLWSTEAKTAGKADKIREIPLLKSTAIWEYKINVISH